MNKFEYANVEQSKNQRVLSTRPIFNCNRHPLQELSVDAFVPNDTLLGDALDGPNDSSSMAPPQTLTNDDSRFAVASSETSDNTENKVMILCGANCSGKSVYLKQVHYSVDFDRIITRYGSKLLCLSVRLP